jgi:hypothetical protein
MCADGSEGVSSEFAELLVVSPAVTGPETITVVLDPECGEGIFNFAQRGPVWVTHSDANRAAVEKYWKSKSVDANEVTIWSSPRVGGSEESWLGILDDLERHHGEFAGAGIAAIEVVGAEPTAEARAALRECGYEPAEILPNGFRAIRSTPTD